MQLPPDIQIYTDGSGHVNGYGGWAAFIATPDRNLKDFRMGNANGTSVDRMEFTALLEGLLGAEQMSYQFPRCEGEEAWKLRVQWFTDRESLLHSVQRINERSNCLDLWARFDYFEQRMFIDATFVTKELFAQLPEFKEVDLQSSAGYQQIKSYMGSMPLFYQKV